MKLNLTKPRKFIRQLRTLKSLAKKCTFFQVLDMITLALKYGFSPLEYHLYGFDRKHRIKQQRLFYLSNDRIEKRFRPVLNNRRWTSILGNKLLFYLFYSQLKLAVARVYGFYYPEKGFFLDGGLLRKESDFAEWVERTNPKTLVIKPVGSLGGKGIKIFDELVSFESLMSTEGRQYALSEVFSFMNADIMNRQVREDPYKGFILEEKIEQAEEMNVFGSRSLNTIRVSTLRTKKGEILTDFAMLRVGGKDSITDNLHQGGYVVNIDVNDGNLGEKAFGYIGKSGPWIEEKSVNIKEFFLGGKVPDWREIIEIAKKAALFSPNLFSIGWDIALSKDGPVLMEGNENWDMVIAQVLAGGYLSERRREILKEYGLEFPR